MMTLLKLRKGQYSPVEEKVHTESAALGVAVRDLHLSPRGILVTLIRKGQLILLHGDTMLRSADDALALLQEVQKLAALLGQGA